ncbi:hypothetical protein [Morganella phage Mecenats66]|nr:hypothetical protein [Morganella phage Mecenats66]
MMNRTVSSVRSKAHQMGFGFGKLLGGKTRWTEKEKDDLCWFCAKKYTATEIAWLLGKEKKPVYDMIRNLGVDPVERATRSQEVAAGHFSGEQLHMVRNMMNDVGITAAEAAAALGLDAEKICRVFPG